MTSKTDLRTALENGLLFEWHVDLDDATIELLAEPISQGDTLHLKNIAVYPRTAEAVDVGPGAVLTIRKQLITQARRLEFAKLRVTGERLSGAREGRTVDVTIDLKDR